MKSKRSLLLVEDDRVDIMTIERALKEIKITNKLNIVRNGEEALEFLKNNRNEKPCVILLDLNMPKMNGIEFLKVIRADIIYKKIPAIVITAYGETEIMNQCYEAGANNFMVKPINFAKFKAKIDETLAATEKEYTS